MNNIKQLLFEACLSFIENRHQTIKKQIEEIEISLSTETKSSAGDKHETGRAMLQLEREKVGQQLIEIEKTKHKILKINPILTSKNIALGSLVFTSKFNYFIAISAGEIMIKNELFYAISSQTPIGQLLIGKTIGDIIYFRSEAIKIINVI